jgi:hypothetical protein
VNRSRVKALSVVGVAFVALLAISLLPVGGGLVDAATTNSPGPTMDLSSYSSAPPDSALNFVFIHHSVGGQLLADPGPETGDNAIHSTHPNGGGLRTSLTAAGYAVHEASYASELGERTDLPDWTRTFRNKMDRALQTKLQDASLETGAQNQIVAFKSCFPNSDFRARGTAPGDPSLPELTVENAKALMNELLPLFERQPDTLFVYLTAPPLAPSLPPQPAWKHLAKRVTGRGMTPSRLRAGARLAREFNDWARSPEGWLAGYGGDNVVVFDYFDILTGDGASNLLAYPTEGGIDSHPSTAGQTRAAAAFVPFLNRAVRRAGLAP